MGRESLAKNYEIIEVINKSKTVLVRKIITDLNFQDVLNYIRTFHVININCVFSSSSSFLNMIITCM